ncbi:RTA1 like protein-domain-containing protein [Ilyonectria sp. MPI-CAGE-AT-0026]|nr:RTA1 like protein-domain-containing protein [Ilyonectria sp. MPI-CAGE-AT-0026]
MSQCNNEYADIYKYTPSKVAAVIFVVLFALSSIVHIWQMTKTKTWYLSALIVGCILQACGYIGRAANTFETAGCWTLPPYVVQSLLILIAPALFAASIYMILGRIIILVDGEKYSLIKRRWLTKFFVVGDVISFLMQIGGGGMLTMDDPDKKKLGEKIVVAGLFVQLAFFGFFIVVAYIFHRRMRAAPTQKARNPDIKWQLYLLTLYVTSFLILVRSVFRVIEYIQGSDGALLSNEIYIYIFDALLMWIVVVWMNYFHPSEIGLLLRGEKTYKNGFELLSHEHL